MKSRKIIIVFINLMLGISLCCCVPDEVILHGDISGFVTDAETNEPLPDATISLNTSNDSTQTVSDGSYLLKNLDEGDHQLLASKEAYEIATKNVTIVPANTSEVNFGLSKESHGEFSETYLDFGLDSTTKYFTISNIGAGTLRYALSTSRDWITVDPSEGNVATESDTIMVTLDRTGLPDDKIEEIITITFYVGDNPKHDQVDVFANGVADQDGNYYGIVTIGSQVWMAESLNTGKRINWSLDNRTNNDGVIEKYCYDNIEENCEIFGGMYSWYEAMDYNQLENDPLIFIQGVCPDGWHIPDLDEWLILFDYAGGTSFAGGNLKDTGTVENGTSYWFAPNEGATDNYGFTALPGGAPWPDGISGKGEVVQFHCAFMENYYILMAYNTAAIERNPDDDQYNPADYVRCIKDP